MMDDDARRIGPTMRAQVLASGLKIRQDFRYAARFVFFETGYEDWAYGTHGGTAFVVNYRSKCYGLTAAHVRQDYDWSQLIITEKTVGTKRAPLQGIYYTSSPREEAIGSDILDVVVLEFVESITCAFFECTPPPIDGRIVMPRPRHWRLALASYGAATGHWKCSKLRWSRWPHREP